MWSTYRSGDPCKFVNFFYVQFPRTRFDLVNLFAIEIFNFGRKILFIDFFELSQSLVFGTEFARRFSLSILNIILNNILYILFVFFIFFIFFVFFILFSLFFPLFPLFSFLFFDINLFILFSFFSFVFFFFFFFFFFDINLFILFFIF
ncbi:hypothetical protein V1511DRAFT_349909 [Dipodascopsis uninucleata]